MIILLINFENALKRCVIIVNISKLMSNTIKTSEYKVLSMSDQKYDFIQVVRIDESIAQLSIIFDKDSIRCHNEVNW